MKNHTFKHKLKYIGKTVSNQRIFLGLSQEELSKKSGIDRTYISRIERGIVNPSILILYKIARILKMTMNDYFLY